MAKNYEDLVSRAENAVSGVKDGELRRVAFEKVLDDLLGQSSDESAVAVAEPRPVGGKPKPPAREAEAGLARRGPQGRVEELIAEGYFGKPKTITEVKAELENRGHHIPLTSLNGPLQKLCQRKTLRRQKATAGGGKWTFVYSNW